MVIKQSTLAALAILAAVSTTRTANAAETLPGEGPGVEQYGMECAPRRAVSGDTVRIRFPAPHGHDFAVASPDGELYFIAFQQPDRSSAVQPLVPENRFATMTEFSVPLAEFKGIPWRTPGGARVIFRESGTYTLLVSPALETEDPLIEGWCKITFAP